MNTPVRRLLFLSLVFAGCHAAPLKFTAAQWPEADALFHPDPKWLGADAAYSVSLGADRTLWLFGDTIIATSAANKRSESKMVRNTIAIQTGADPLTAKMAFAWGDENQRNKPFVYAAKAHPELSAGGALAVTYVSNTFDDFSVLVNDSSIYFPRFVKVTLSP